ncbi:MAG: hypothetical protein EYC62_03980 [Alphaproteobacteria bacterium]|nr:MAG: hypothetical protein EYC62_03980 [Alphaproteobacteria bacterium]
MSESLILASSSIFRRQILDRAGLLFTAHAADLPEDEMMLDWQKKGTTAEHVARELSVAKAMKISAKFPGAHVIGCDQMMLCQDRWFAKPKSRAEAAEHLQFLSGKTHRLISGIAVVRNGKVLWDHVDIANMTMRPLNQNTIDNYLDEMGDKVLQSVGCYQIEGLGIQLFDKIEGDFFGIVGLPLLPLLQFLRAQKVIA